MQLGIIDIIAFLLVTFGPGKALPVYAALTLNADDALRREIVRRTVMVSGIVGSAVHFPGPFFAADIRHNHARFTDRRGHHLALVCAGNDHGQNRLCVWRE
ncbi:MAG: hypothetical protein ACR2OR_09420 [Hyphomicrobiales bacterium]